MNNNYLFTYILLYTWQVLISHEITEYDIILAYKPNSRMSHTPKFKKSYKLHRGSDYGDFSTVVYV